MGLIEDISRFLETRLEEFIRNNPQIELQILEDKLRQQEEEIAKLIVSSKLEEKKTPRSDSGNRRRNSRLARSHCQSRIL